MPIKEPSVAQFCPPTKGVKPNPEYPLVPLNPLIPEVPENPDSPCNPSCPLIPDHPLNPEVPLYPEKPLMPDSPFIPSAPERSDVYWYVEPFHKYNLEFSGFSLSPVSIIAN